MNILTEIYQFLFISSIIFMIYIFSDLVIKMYGRFKLDKETQFVLTISEKIILWISLGIFFTYLF
jgi:hypothetical protein